MSPPHAFVWRRSSWAIELESRGGSLALPSSTRLWASLASQTTSVLDHTSSTRNPGTGTGGSWSRRGARVGFEILAFLAGRGSRFRLSWLLFGLFFAPLPISISAISELSELSELSDSYSEDPLLPVGSPSDADAGGFAGDAIVTEAFVRRRERFRGAGGFAGFAFGSPNRMPRGFCFGIDCLGAWRRTKFPVGLEGEGSSLESELEVGSLLPPSSSWVSGVVVDFGVD